MVMAEYFTYDRLQELWQQIHHLHLTYLDTEDSPQKIEQRNKLEVCIRDYLCIAPHSQKFYCPETAEVLHRSASSKKDFSGYRAALAWNAVSMYAGNLLSQPWRKEYRTIKTYSGFYKHQIDTNLVGAEAMFESMGYKHAGEGILVLEGPVCPDRVTNVSQDSIVAFVECQIIKTIWEEVSNKFKISWLDVLEFRESHIYSPEESVRMLNYRLNERRYHEQQPPRNSDTNYSTLLRYTIPPAAHPPPLQQQHQHHQQQQQQQQQQQMNHAPPLSGMHSFPPPSGHLAHIPPHNSHYNPGMAAPAPLQAPTPINNHIAAPSQMCPSQCIYSNPYYNYNYAPPINYHPRYGTVPQHYSVPLPCSTKPCNGYCYPNGCVPPPSYICPVPTGQLIELDTAHAHAHAHTHAHAQNGCYDVVDSAAKRQQDQLESHKQLAKSTNLDSLTLSKSKEDGAGTFESWDYVYRNLESQGYYKDLSERPDVLQQNEKKRHSNLKKTVKPSIEIEIENEFNNLHMNEASINKAAATAVLKRNNNKENDVKKVEDYHRVGQSNSYDNISLAHQEMNNKPVKSISNGISKTLPRQIVSPEKEKQKPQAQPSNHTAATATTLDTKKLRKQDVDKMKLKYVMKQKGKDDSSGWNCNTCTYLNKPAVEICMMCGKSKNNVDVVMAVGGSQCPDCTLVNKKDVINCEACNASLINSPTYI